MLKGMFNFLKPGGTICIETTSQWSKYYMPFWPLFEDQAKNPELEAFSISKEQMLSKNLTGSDVFLLNKSQAEKLFLDHGFINIEITQFRTTTPAISGIGYDIMLAILATRP